MKNRLSLVERLEYHYCKLCEAKYNVGVDPKFLNPDGTRNKEAIKAHVKSQRRKLLPGILAGTAATLGAGALAGHKLLGGAGGAALGMVGSGLAVSGALKALNKSTAREAQQLRMQQRKAALAKQAQQNK